MNSMYAKITNYAEDPTLEARTCKIVGRGWVGEETVYVQKGTSTGVAIPPRQPVFSLDLSKITEAQAQADYILHTIFGK